jgi:dephospho-CoA kinase
MDHEAFQYAYGEGRQYLINNFLTTDKRTVSSLVFNCPALLKDMNAHYKPHIKRIFLEWLEWPFSTIIEFPLLFECFDAPEERAMIRDHCTVVTVYADDEVRYLRASGRDRKTVDMVQDVDRCQMLQTEKCKLADIVMVNNPGLDTNQVIRNLIEELNGRPSSTHIGILRPAVDWRI